MMNTETMMAMVTMMSKLNDEDLKTVMNTISVMSDSKKTGGVKTTPVEPKDKEFNLAPIQGKVLYEDDGVTVTSVKQGRAVAYRFYMHIPTYWGRKGRTPQEARRVRDYIKDRTKTEAKQYGAKWSGDYNTRDFHWTFTDKKAADAYIKFRKSTFNSK